MQQEGMDSESRQETVSNEPKQKGQSSSLTAASEPRLETGEVMTGRGFQQNDFQGTSTS